MTPTAIDGEGQYATGSGTYHGLTVKGPCELNVFDGTDNTGLILDIIILADGESASAWYERGIDFHTGVFLEDVGTDDPFGSLRIGA